MSSCGSVCDVLQFAYCMRNCALSRTQTQMNVTIIAYSMTSRTEGLGIKSCVTLYGTCTPECWRTNQRAAFCSILMWFHNWYARNAISRGPQHWSVYMYVLVGTPTFRRTRTRLSLCTWCHTVSDGTLVYSVKAMSLCWVPVHCICMHHLCAVYMLYRISPINGSWSWIILFITQQLC